MGYLAAAVVVVAIAGARVALSPLLGTQSPLLPFVLGVFLSAFIGGRGPALLACILAPLLATLWFTHWPHGSATFQWGAHIAFFLAIGVLVSLLMHALQAAHQEQAKALASAHATACQARESAAQLRLIADALPVLIAYVDRSCRYIFTNREHEDWFDDPCGELLGRHAREVWGEPTYEQMRSKMELALSGHAVSFEAQISLHDQVRQVAAHYVPDLDADARVKGFFALIEDISERKRDEVALRASETRLRLVTDHLPVLVCYIDRDEVFRFTNAAYKEWFERDPTDPPVSMREALTESAYTQRAPYVQRVLGGELVRFEGVTTHRTLGERLMELTYVPERSLEGDVQGFYVMAQDITERHSAQEELRQANQRKDDFLAMLAHELRNPLAPIRNVAHLLANGTPDADTVRRASELLQRQANQLTRLVDDLLDVARITRGAIELKKERLDLRQVLDAALESTQPLLASKHQTVTVERSAEPLYVDGDPVRLCQVFINLITNAAKFSPERSSISLLMECTKQDVIVTVHDLGIGIDPQILPHLFELFLQADRSLDRAQGGLGIGLTIVKHLVGMHGGVVKACSAGLGQGSQFVVQLPRAPAPAAQLAQSERLSHPPANGRRILLVEDSVDSATSLALLLEMAGHEVSVTHDGAAALSALEHFAPQVILLDIGLPGMDGYMVARLIHERFPNLTSRLYALTGYGRTEDQQLALAAGFDDHLTKPVDPERLLRLIAETEPGLRCSGVLPRSADSQGLRPD